MSKLALMTRFSSFIDSLAGTDNIAIFHHNDPDGVCSGMIVFLALQRLPAKPEIVLVKPIGYEACKNGTLAQILREKKADKAIMVDVCVDQFPNCPKEMEKNLKRFLIIDHHKKYHDLNSEKTVFIKAVDMGKKIDPSRYINAKLTFDLFSKKAGLKDIAWIVCVGILMLKKLVFALPLRTYPLNQQNQMSILFHDFYCAASFLRFELIKILNTSTI